MEKIYWWRIEYENPTGKGADAMTIMATQEDIGKMISRSTQPVTKLEREEEDN